jgi:hypothetical protein
MRIRLTRNMMIHANPLRLKPQISSGKMGINLSAYGSRAVKKIHL